MVCHLLLNKLLQQKIYCIIKLMVKHVIAYFHTHWDREWYREFETFRIRLLSVFDNVLDMLSQNKIPSFYFDGQVSALLDYLELRPEKENIVRKFIKEKKLFIGPFYNIVDEYLEDLSTKTIKQDNEQICVEISGYVSPENIGKAIDDTIQDTEADGNSQIIQETIVTDHHDGQIISNEENPPLPETVTAEIKESTHLPEEANPNQDIILLSTVYIKPTEFYNGSQSSSHSEILKRILMKSDKIRIIDVENDANFVVTPRVGKARIEPLNDTTSRMQMVVSLDVFDRNKNQITTETQNKYVLFNSEDNEQSVAKQMLSQLLELNSDTVLRLAEKSAEQTYQNQREVPQGL